MNKLFYPKLAVINIKKNNKFYFPYLLTCISMIAMFYIMCFITFNDGLKKLPGAQDVSFIMRMGTVIIGIFSAIFLFYTNSFLIKRRKKELGLYNILGMEKRHIAKILLFEATITSIITLVIGLISGILFSKLIFLLLIKILNYSVPMGFSISVDALIITTILFFFIFVATLLSNLLQIRLAKPIELLKGGNTGEKEPKTKWLLTIIGILTTGIGYYIAITTEAPLTALNLFFIAALLVIIGTYCLFTAGSIALLKQLRKNKNYYYKTENFTSIAGLIYRMKQNAVGLANICILSTMVLVMVSTTVSMYVGADNLLDNRFPTDIKIEIFNPTEAICDSTLQSAKNTVAKHNMTMSNLSNYKYLPFNVGRDGDTFTTDMNTSNTNLVKLLFITTDQYELLSGKRVALAQNEVLVYTVEDQIGDSFTLMDKQYKVVDYLDTFKIGEDFTTRLFKLYYVVVSDDIVLDELYQGQLNAYGKEANQPTYTITFDLDGTSDDKIACFNNIQNAFSKNAYNTTQVRSDKKVTGRMESKQASQKEFYSVYGGLLFLGIFLGILFLTATVLIIYYKQISEGYDDKERFEIMQKVGMGHNEIKRSIRSQVLKVFFLPIIMAVIHIAAAFKMITRLLAVLNLTDVTLFLICTISTVLIFAVIYGIVYALTAKVYYSIVSK